MKAKREILIQYLGILFGVFLTALALDWFLIPNKIAAGGVSGLATVIYHVFHLPVGVTMLAINIPLFLLAWRVLGRTFGLRSLVGTVALSVFVDLLEGYLHPLTGDPLLAAIYGGALAGLGMGLTIRYGGSTGGTDLAAMVAHRLLHTSVGMSLLVIDGLVILLAGLVFNAELALYALLSILITTKAIDLIQEGQVFGKAAYIISSHPEEIANAVLSELDRGVTGLKGVGKYTGKPREVLFVIVSRHEIQRLKEIVRRYDPQAFIVITDAHEVLGEGFLGLATEERDQ
ncbi:MAG: YitT family protein [Firmicutes bacterium]|nr:YitT family protein [Bacillota bacterium]